MLPLQSRKTGNALLSQPQVDGHGQQYFTLLQFHLAAVCSGHAFNIQSVRIRASCAAVIKTFGAASHQHQPGSQNYKQEKRGRPYFLFHCRVSYSLSSNLKIASALSYETNALRPA